MTKRKKNLQTKNDRQSDTQKTKNIVLYIVTRTTINSEMNSDAPEG